MRAALYGWVFNKTRREAGPPAELAGAVAWLQANYAVELRPLTKVPYHLRHVAVSTWLNAGVPAPQVAEWAGHSVHVLMRALPLS
jgi:hypothetical protein